MRTRFRWNVTYAVVPAFVLMSITFTWPLIAHFDKAIPSFRLGFDPLLQAFLVAWDWHALPHGLAFVFNAPMFYPEPRALTYMDHLLGEAAVGGSIIAMSGSVAAAYNALVLLSFITSAWAVYRLARLIGAQRFGAFLAGLFFAFAPYRFANLDLLNQLQTQFLPLGLFFAIRYLQRWKLRDAVGLAATFVAQSYFGWYYTFYLLVALFLLLGLVLATRTWCAPAGHPARLLLLGAAVMAAILPIAWPYVAQRLSMPEFRRTLGQTALYSADLLDYLKTYQGSVLARLLCLPTGAQSFFPGFAASALAVIGASRVLRQWNARRGSAFLGARFALLLAPVSLVLSLGPVLHFAGHRILIPLPYAALYFVMPGLSSLRAPARLAVLVTLGVALLAALGYRDLRDTLNRRANATSGRYRTGAALAGAALLAAIFGAAVYPISMLELPTRRTMPPVYAWLASRDLNEPVLEVPVPVGVNDGIETNALHQYLVLLHGHRRLDGCSGFVSKRYLRFRDQMQSFPDSNALDAAARMGAKIVIVHYGELEDGAARRLEERAIAAPRLNPLARFGDDAAYELLP